MARSVLLCSLILLAILGCSAAQMVPEVFEKSLEKDIDIQTPDHGFTERSSIIVERGLPNPDILRNSIRFGPAVNSSRGFVLGDGRLGWAAYVSQGATSSWIGGFYSYVVGNFVST